jgi:pimeloyl-ACP methyl ester carboxylesterase
MADATRLTREGRLEGATALIRRTLRGAFVPAADTGDGPKEPIEAPSRVENEASHPTAPDPTRPALRRAPKPSGKPSRRFRGLSRLPGTAPGAVPDFCPPPVVPTGGRFVERSYTNRAGTRDYKLYIPSGYVGQEVSLIVMLHGCTQDPDDFAAGARMNALAEEHTFLVAYPAQAASANTSRCWNWFKPGDQRRGQGEPSIIAGITCEVVGEYHLDPGRVYVAGMSAGGAMAAIMGATYPDLYAAIGVHSGLAPGAAHDCPPRSPLCDTGAWPPRVGTPPPGSSPRSCRPSRSTGIAIRPFTRATRTAYSSPGSSPTPRAAGRSRAGRLRWRRCIWGTYPAGMPTPAPSTTTAALAPLWTVDRPRSRACLVGWKSSRLVHRPQGTRRLGGDGSILPTAPATATN